MKGAVGKFASYWPAMAVTAGIAGAGGSVIAFAPITPFSARASATDDAFMKSANILELPGELEADEASRDLARILHDCRLTLHVREEPFAITLWAQDEGERGVIETNEVLCVEYSPLLETLTARMAPEAVGRADSSILYPDVPARAWSQIDGATAHVLGAGVTAVTVESAPAGEGASTLTLRLTWRLKRTDSPGVTVIELTKRASSVGGAAGG